MATGRNLPARRQPKSGSLPVPVRIVGRTVATGFRYARTGEPGFIAGAAPVSMYVAEAVLAGPTAPITLAFTSAAVAGATRYITSSEHAKRNRAMRRIGKVLCTYPPIMQASTQAPRMKNFARTPAGFRVDIEVPKRCDALVFENLLPLIENDLRSEVRIERIEAPRFGPVAAIGSALSKTSQKVSRGSGVQPVSDRVARGGVRMKVIERDTLAKPLASPWPVLVPAQRLRADGSPVVDGQGRPVFEIPARPWTDPIPVSLDEDGLRVDLSFRKRPSILVGGESGSGKSSFTHEVVDAWILDPRSELMLWDGKGMLELNRYMCLTGGQIAGPDLVPAMRQLLMLKAELDRREKYLYDNGLEEAAPDDPECPPLLAVIEEFTAYKDADFINLLIYIAVRIRVVNMRLLITVQRPSAKTVPTDLRDNIGMRICHSVLTPDSSDMALGEGWAKRGWNAQLIPMDDKGTFAGINLLLNDGGSPRRTRSWFPTPEMRTIATRRALELRGLPMEWADLRGAALARAVKPLTAAAPRVAVAAPSTTKPTAPRPAPTPTPVAVADPEPDRDAARKAHNGTQMAARRRSRPSSRARRLHPTPSSPTTTSKED